MAIRQEEQTTLNARGAFLSSSRPASSQRSGWCCPRPEFAGSPESWRPYFHLLERNHDLSFAVEITTLK